jgi:3-hydroxyacyl-[acyl-carrier-protein] dehydratase
MLARREDITRYIPQRQPMVMVHDLVEANETQVVTRFLVERESTFVVNDQLTEPGLVENMAQTAAAQVGYSCSLKNIPVPIGYIAAVKDLKIVRLPGMNALITTTVTIIDHILDVTRASGRVEEGGELCCSCELRIFIKREP